MGNLTRKQEKWLNEYLQCWNATEAARRAGYKAPNTQGPRLLLDVGMQDAIQQRLNDAKMTADEVLHMIGEIGRASIEDLMNVDENGRLSFDFKRAQVQKKLHLIKSITPTAHGIKVELCDRMKALELMGKHHKLFVDRSEVSGADGNPISVIIKQRENGD